MHTNRPVGIVKKREQGQEDMLTKIRSLALASALVLATGAPGFAQSPTAPQIAPYKSSVPPEQRRAFFGELHLHTVMSLDAWTFGTKVTPDQAYKFARGEVVMVPAAQIAKEQGIQGTADVPAQRVWPLDFTAVTDHSEYAGALHQLDDPASAFSNSDVGKQVQALVASPGRRGGLRGAAAMIRNPDVIRAVKAAADASNWWNIAIKAANDNYEPGKFTTFIAYEWTASPGEGVHMHRNVIFDADHAPVPFTAVDSNKPEDLWKYLDSVRKQGIDVLAIPHNSNLSDGHDFDWNMSDGRPIDEAYAQERALNEPLVEIKQLKGSSETTPELSPEDEFANFEVLDRVYKNESAPNQHGSYVREAYGRGLVIQANVGVNPFKMGVVGASDIHNGLTASGESSYASGVSGIDPRTMLPRGDAAKSALGMGKSVTPTEEGGRNRRLQLSSAAITGVWAEENTRDAIFAALKRKETFATSGTRIRVRMFGGWSFKPNLLKKKEWIREAYATGVPMGGDLPTKPVSAIGPRFVLQAEKDPDGANLDRIEIIKVWLEGHDYKEKVFDVALSGGRKDDAKGRAPAVGDTVDLKTGAYTNTIGAAVLQTEWRDPEFDSAKPAVYYARVLEIPTPRWSTLLAIKNGLPIPAGAPVTIQERAWTSPIWFTPARS